MQSGLERIIPQARQSLRRRGLLAGLWPDRLAKANAQLIRFVNRFHRVAGFEWVIRDYFANKYKRDGANLAMRFAQRLADRERDYPRHMYFERALSIAPGGHSVLLVDLTNNGVHYQFKPWSRVDPLAVQGQLLRDMTIFGSPSRVRWVFDGKRLGRKKVDLVREVRRILTGSQSPMRKHPAYRQWLDALDRLIVVVR